MLVYPVCHSAISSCISWYSLYVYFRDPENNRLEIFCDTPWFVNQPCKFSIDITKTDEELIEFTKNKIIDMPGFSDATAWHNAHRDKIGYKSVERWSFTVNPLPDIAKLFIFKL
jgi:catechol-2,3-dioxygenase